MKAGEKMLKLLDEAAHPDPGQTFTTILPAPGSASTALTRTSWPGAQLSEETLRTATRLRMALADGERSIAFTGFESSDLGSELARQMALALSRFAPAQVLLVTAGPTPDTRTGPGLAEVLSGECGLQSALGEAQDGGPWLLSSGNMDADRAHLFFSPECSALFAGMTQRFKHVVVDAGPLSSPASLVVIGRCDTVALALAAGQHHKSEIVRAQKDLARAKARMLGVVLTGKKP